MIDMKYSLFTFYKWSLVVQILVYKCMFNLITCENTPKGEVIKRIKKTEVWQFVLQKQQQTVIYLTR